MEGQIELEDYLRSLNCEGFDICDYIPKGRASAVTRYELCMKTGFRDRQVRDLIHYARRDGSILNLSDGKGYFRPDLDDPVERGMLAAYVRQEESRRDSIDWSLNGAIKDCKENGINSNQKGKKGELELAAILKSYGYEDSRRGQQYCGSNGDADVVGLPEIHIECKRVEKLNIYDAVEQSKNDARTGEMPVVMHRKNRKEWLVTMPLDDWMKLYEKMVEEVQNA